jgi:hypothetical protein
MTDTNEVTTVETDRVKYNRRIREKRKKGHSFQMITDYAAGCPVPVDQLHDLTPEEMDKVKVLRVEVEKRRIEQAAQEERARIAAEERARQELEARKARVTASEVKAKEAPADRIVPVDAALFDGLGAVLLVSLSFAPGRTWEGSVVTNAYDEFNSGYGGELEWSSYRMPEALKKPLQALEFVKEWV